MLPDASNKKKQYIEKSRTIWLKVSRSKDQSVHSVFARIDAALGALYNKESSPKASPGKYSLRNLSSSSGFWFFLKKYEFFVAI